MCYASGAKPATSESASYSNLVRVVRSVDKCMAVRWVDKCMAVRCGGKLDKCMTVRWQALSLPSCTPARGEGRPAARLHMRTCISACVADSCSMGSVQSVPGGTVHMWAAWAAWGVGDGGRVGLKAQIGTPHTRTLLLCDTIDHDTL